MKNKKVFFIHYNLVPHPCPEVTFRNISETKIDRSHLAYICDSELEFNLQGILQPIYKLLQ